MEGVQREVVAKAREQKDLVVPKVVELYRREQAEDASRLINDAALLAKQPGADLADCTKSYLWNRERLAALDYVFNDGDPAPFYWAESALFGAFRSPLKDYFALADLEFVNGFILFLKEQHKEQRGLLVSRLLSADQARERYEKVHLTNSRLFSKFAKSGNFGSPKQKAQALLEYYGRSIAYKSLIPYLTVSDGGTAKGLRGNKPGAEGGATANHQILKIFLAKRDGAGGSNSLYRTVIESVPKDDGGRRSLGAVRSLYSKCRHPKDRPAWLTGDVITHIISELQAEGKPIDWEYFRAINGR